MIKYFLKSDDSEKGPLTLKDLKRLKVKGTDEVRLEGGSEWTLIKDVPELKGVFKKTLLLVKLLVLFSVIAIVFIIAFVNGKSTHNRSSRYAENQNKHENIKTERIPTPPIISYNLSKHKKKIVNEFLLNCKRKKKKLRKACNYDNSYVRNKAVSIAGKSEGSYNLGQVCDIFDYCYDNWKYVDDPENSEYYSTASGTLKNGLNGDCDDFAILTCSMILSVGGEARINSVKFQKGGGHAFTEINIGKTDIKKVKEYLVKRYKNKSIRSLFTRRSANEDQWLSLDWFSGYPGARIDPVDYGNTFYIYPNQIGSRIIRQCYFLSQRCEK